MDDESIRLLSDYVDRLAGAQRVVAEDAPTRENWNAVKCLDDASRALFSAAAWIAREKKEDEDGA